MPQPAIVRANRIRRYFQAPSPVLQIDKTESALPGLLENRPTNHPRPNTYRTLMPDRRAWPLALFLWSVAGWAVYGSCSLGLLAGLNIGTPAPAIAPQLVDQVLIGTAWGMILGAVAGAIISLFQWPLMMRCASSSRLWRLHAFTIPPGIALFLVNPFASMVLVCVAQLAICMWFCCTSPPLVQSCSHCGYPVEGLSRPWCPECGMGVDFEAKDPLTHCTACFQPRVNPGSPSCEHCGCVDLDVAGHINPNRATPHRP